MALTEKYLTPHSLFEDQTFDQFCTKLPAIYFKEQVHEDVLKNFDVIDHLLAHSYFDYRFIDEAFNKALATLEMAMNFRYNELNKKYHKVAFGKLTQFLLSNNQFDSNPATLKFYQDMRNHHSHPKLHGFAGLLLWNHFEQVANLINEMYEDTDLRIERKRIFADTEARMDNSKLFSPVIVKIGDDTTIAYKLTLLFIDNKTVPHHYHFGFTPIFDYEPIGEMHIQDPASNWLTLKNVTLSNNILYGNDIDDDKRVTFAPLASDTDAFATYSKWVSDFNLRKEAFLYERSINRNNGLFYTELYREFIKK